MTTSRETSRPSLPARIGAWFLDLPPVRWIKPILDDYDAAGGGLLASGLAFNFLFALLPAILLVVSLLGLFLTDPLELERVVNELASRFPPLEDFFRTALESVTSQAVSFGILGAAGLVWGSSRFYQSLDDAIARIFHGSRRRDPIQRGIRGVLAVVLLIGAVVGAVFAVTVAQSFAERSAEFEFAFRFATSTIGTGLVTILIFGVAIGLIYRTVPTETPAWRAIRVPAVVIGIGVAVLTTIFALLAPRLVGGLKVYGAFVAVFAAMIWLSYLAQAILVGAVWVRRRTLPTNIASGQLVDRPAGGGDGG